MKNYIQEGRHITVISQENITSGQVYVDGALYGVATHSATKGGELTIRTDGVYKLTLPAGIKVGDEVFYKKDQPLAKTGDFKIGVVVSKDFEGYGAVLLK